MPDDRDEEQRKRAAALDKLIRESKPRELTPEQRRIGGMYQRLRKRAKQLAKQ